jgi:hypothetical protein
MRAGRPRSHTYFFMKTYRNLYPQVYDFENLYLSYRAARRAIHIADSR